MASGSADAEMHARGETPRRQHGEAEPPAQFLAVCRRSEMVAMGREGLKAAHVFAGDEPYTGMETYRVSARFDALQNVIN